MSDESTEKTDKIYVGTIDKFNTALAMEGYKKNHNYCDSITICIYTMCPPSKRPLCSRKNILTIFDQLKGLESYQQDIFRIRYYPLFKNYQRRCFLYALIFHTSRFIVTVGSITVPALLALQSTTDPRITWIVWTISLAVTIFNGVLTLFKIDKKYYFLHTTKELLESEGWQYIALTGKYSKLRDSEHMLNTHQAQFTHFCLAIERIKMRQVEEEYYKAQETNTGTSAPNTSQPKTTAAAPVVQQPQPAIMNDMYNSALLKGSSASPSSQTEEMKQWVNSIVDPSNSGTQRNRQHVVALQRQIDELKASIDS
jgi:hypothetical protein